MKKLELLLLLLVSSIVCYASSVYGYDYEDAQHIKITFKDSTVVEKDSEKKNDWTCYWRMDDYSSWENHKGDKDNTKICIWDATTFRGKSTWGQMQGDYEDFKNKIVENNKYAEYKIFTGVWCGDYYTNMYNIVNVRYNIVNVILNKDEIEKIEIW